MTEDWTANLPTPDYRSDDGSVAKATLFNQPTDLPAPRFHGDTYVAKWDEKRLTTLLGRVYTLMQDGQWRTLGEIRDAFGGGGEASISARIRQLGSMGYKYEKRRRGEPKDGLWEYRFLMTGGQACLQG